MGTTSFWTLPPPLVSTIFCPVTSSSAELMRSVGLELYILLSMVGAVFDGFRAFQLPFLVLIMIQRS